jgi:hypothetical protein
MEDTFKMKKMPKPSPLPVPTYKVHKPITIDKGIPVPEISARKGMPKYPIEDMEVEDSFFVPAEANQYTGYEVMVEKVDQLKKTVYNSAVYFRKRTAKNRDWRFLVVTDYQNYGVRCWRIR